MEDKLKRQQERIDLAKAKKRERDMAAIEKKATQEKQKLEKLRAQQEAAKIKAEKMEIVRQQIANRKKKQSLTAERLNAEEKELQSNPQPVDDAEEDFNAIFDEVVASSRSVSYMNQNKDNIQSSHMLSINFVSH